MQNLEVRMADEEDIEDFMDQVTDILRDRRKGAWVGWVETLWRGSTRRGRGTVCPKDGWTLVI